MRGLGGGAGDLDVEAGDPVRGRDDSSGLAVFERDGDEADRPEPLEDPKVEADVRRRLRPVDRVQDLGLLRGDDRVLVAEQEVGREDGPRLRVDLRRGADDRRKPAKPLEEERRGRLVERGGDVRRALEGHDGEGPGAPLERRVEDLLRERPDAGVGDVGSHRPGVPEGVRQASARVREGPLEGREQDGLVGEPERPEELPDELGLPVRRRRDEPAPVEPEAPLLSPERHEDLGVLPASDRPSGELPRAPSSRAFLPRACRPRTSKCPYSGDSTGPCPPGKPSTARFARPPPFRPPRRAPAASPRGPPRRSRRRRGAAAPWPARGPGSPGGGSSSVRRVRALRWCFRPKRCASSRARWSSFRPAWRRGRTTGRERPGHEDLLFPLREADRRELDPDPVERPEGGRQLALSAVDDEEVGERLAFRATPLVAPGDGLGDRREVVGHGAVDPEHPVLPFRRLAVDEDDARGVGVAPLEVRDVEALDPRRPVVEVERLREGQGRLLPRLAHGLEAPDVARPGVVPGDLHPVERGSPLRRPHLHPGAAALREPRLDGSERLLRNLVGKVDLPREERRRVVVLRQERHPELLRVDVADPLPEELPRVEDRPSPHVQDRHGEVPVVGEVAEDVDVLARERLDALLLRQLLDRSEAVPVRRRHLVALGFGGGLHLRRAGEARARRCGPTGRGGRRGRPRRTPPSSSATPRTARGRRACRSRGRGAAGSRRSRSGTSGPGTSAAPSSSRRGRSAPGGTARSSCGRPSGRAASRSARGHSSPVVTLMYG